MNKISIAVSMWFLFCSSFVVSGQKHGDLVQHSTTVHLNGIQDSRGEVFEQNIAKFLDDINAAYRANQNPKFSSAIADISVNETVGDLWAVSPFASVRTEIIENVLSTSQGNYEVRNIQIVFDEAQPGYEQQDAVILLNAKGKIIDFKIALGYHSVLPIRKDAVDVTDLRRREMILAFIEDFRTSYNLRDIDYLEKVFSDRALIITGKVLKQTEDGELKTNVTYRKQTKQEYLHNLKSLFARVKMISISFDSISVVRHPTYTYMYGVTLQQSWVSEYTSGGGYRDVGYLFLVIDFKVEDNPKIWVRTWQNIKDISYEYSVFSFDNFHFE